MKQIRWTAHARQKMIVRKISAAIIEEAVFNPDSVTNGDFGRIIYMKRYYDTILQSVMLLRVIAEEAESEIAIISVYKTSNFRKYLGDMENEG